MQAGGKGRELFFLYRPPSSSPPLPLFLCFFVSVFIFSFFAFCCCFRFASSLCSFWLVVPFRGCFGLPCGVVCPRSSRFGLFLFGMQIQLDLIMWLCIEYWFFRGQSILSYLLLLQDERPYFFYLKAQLAGAGSLNRIVDLKILVLFLERLVSIFLDLFHVLPIFVCKCRMTII